MLAATLVGSALAWAACGTADGRTKDPETSASAAVAVAPVAAIEQPIPRFIRVSGTLMAEDQSDVAAEIAGRVVATPIERGTPVAQGAELIRISPTETEAQMKEADANAAQIEARLGMTANTSFDVNAVPEVENAKASYALAQSEFARIKSLLDERVVSQSEYDQRRTQMDASRQQYEAAKNTALQQYQSLQAARARVMLARKALADTVVRVWRPWRSGWSGGRLRHQRDEGGRRRSSHRPRAQLTIPEQFVAPRCRGPADHVRG